MKSSGVESRQLEVYLLNGRSCCQVLNTRLLDENHLLVLFSIELGQNLIGCLGYLGTDLALDLEACLVVLSVSEGTVDLGYKSHKTTTEAFRRPKNYVTRVFKRARVVVIPCIFKANVGMLVELDIMSKNYDKFRMIIYFYILFLKNTMY